eukprot:3335907-Prymnesium_polylepis.1
MRSLHVSWAHPAGSPPRRDQPRGPGGAGARCAGLKRRVAARPCGDRVAPQSHRPSSRWEGAQVSVREPEAATGAVPGLQVPLATPVAVADVEVPKSGPFHRRLPQRHGAEVRRAAHDCVHGRDAVLDPVAVPATRKVGTEVPARIAKQIAVGAERALVGAYDQPDPLPTHKGVGGQIPRHHLPEMGVSVARAVAPFAAARRI